MKRFLLALGALALSACASMESAPTAPSSGYTEEMVSANRYRITYTGPVDAKPALIADRALSHAAKVTLDKGNEWFEVASKINGDHAQTLVIVMGKGETLAGGPQMYDAKDTLNRLKGKIS